MTALELLQEELVLVQWMCAVHFHAATEGLVSPIILHISAFALRDSLVLTVRLILITANHTPVRIMQHVSMV